MAYNEVIVTGKTVALALEEGAAQLGKSVEEVQHEVLEEPKKGLFGIGASDAKLRVYCEIAEEVEEVTEEAEGSVEEAAEVEQEAQEGEVAMSDLPVPAQKAIEFLRTLVDHMHPGAEIELVSCEENELSLNIAGDHLGSLIGRRGDVLDSIQYLTTLAANIGNSGYCRVTVDAQGYRAKRVAVVSNIARQMAEKVVKYNRSFRLDPMTPYERRIVHAVCQDFPGVTSHSVGEGSERYVVISPDKGE